MVIELTRIGKHTSDKPTLCKNSLDVSSAAIKEWARVSRVLRAPGSCPGPRRTTPPTLHIYIYF